MWNLQKNRLSAQATNYISPQTDRSLTHLEKIKKRRRKVVEKDLIRNESIGEGTPNILLWPRELLAHEVGRGTSMK